jgi:hypothetical protein
MTMIGIVNLHIIEC